MGQPDATFRIDPATPADVPLDLARAGLYLEELYVPPGAPRKRLRQTTPRAPRPHRGRPWLRPVRVVEDAPVSGVKRHGYVAPESGQSLVDAFHAGGSAGVEKAPNLKMLSFEHPSQVAHAHTFFLHRDIKRPLHGDVNWDHNAYLS